MRRSISTHDQPPQLVQAFREHFNAHFDQPENQRKGYHSNFIENMAELTATNNKVYNKWETLYKHLVLYFKI